MLRVCQWLASIAQNVKRNLLLLLVNSRVRFTLRKLNYVLFSSAYSLVRGFLCRKQICTITVTHHWTGHRYLIALAPASNSHRSIARYRPTIVLTAPGGRSVHSMR